MPVLVPFAVGVLVGVCVAPSVRRQPKLEPAFVVVDAIQETIKDVCKRGHQVLKDLQKSTCCQPASPFGGSI